MAGAIAAGVWSGKAGEPNVCFQWKADASWFIMVNNRLDTKESDMAGILDKFHVERGVTGVRVIARSRQLSSDCTTDSEIDDTVQMLKDDLDACAREMKRLVAIDARGAMFQGWPSAKDDLLDADA
jgi:hypothetical protein